LQRLGGGVTVVAQSWRGGGGTALHVQLRHALLVRESRHPQGLEQQHMRV